MARRSVVPRTGRTRRTCRTPVLVLLAIALFSIPAFAQTRGDVRVLVMPFVVRADPASAAEAAGSGWLGEAAALLITDALESRGVEVIGRDERVAAFDRLQLPPTATLTRAATIRTAELIGASDVVVGEVTPAGTALTVVAHVIRLDRAEQLAALTERAATPDAMFAMFARSAARLIESAGWRQGPAAAPVAPMPPSVFQNYVKGLVAATPAAEQRWLELAYREAPRDARVLLALSGVYADQGQHAKALAAARNVPAESPLARKARFAAAVSLIELGRLDEAAKELTALNTERPSPVLWNALGVVQLRRPDSKEDGTENFTHAVNIARDDSDYLFNLGYAFARAHDAARALQWLREAVRFDATIGDAHLVMSIVLETTGRHPEAQRELELARLLGARTVVSGTPAERVPARLERLRTDLDLPRARRVDLALNAPVEQDQQQFAAFQLAEGKRLLADGRDRDAMNAFRRAIYLSPYEDEPHLLLGRLYVRAGRLSEAIDEFKVAIWSRETAEARLALGSALFDNADKLAARVEVLRALALRPGWKEAEDLLARINR
jgi:tetratricopeptide (TPR) repeat protein